MQYIVNNRQLLECFQWAGHDLNKSEDPLVRYYRNPFDSGDRICDYCGHTMHEHGWLDSSIVNNPDGYMVCVNDYVVKADNQYYVLTKDSIKNNYTILNSNIFNISFQSRLYEWFKLTFEKDFPELIDNKRERNHRFLEEALELVQAADMCKDEILNLVEQVYSKPKGDIFKEIGGVATTLTVLCSNHGVDINEAAESELKRNYTIIDKLRAKQPERSSMKSINGIHSKRD